MRLCLWAKPLEETTVEGIVFCVTRGLLVDALVILTKSSAGIALEAICSSPNKLAWY